MPESTPLELDDDDVTAVIDNLISQYNDQLNEIIENVLCSWNTLLNLPHNEKYTFPITSQNFAAFLESNSTSKNRVLAIIISRSYFHFERALEYYNSHGIDARFVSQTVRSCSRYLFYVDDALFTIKWRADVTETIKKQIETMCRMGYALQKERLICLILGINEAGIDYCRETLIWNYVCPGLLEDVMSSILSQKIEVNLKSLNQSWKVLRAVLQISDQQSLLLKLGENAIISAMKSKSAHSKVHMEDSLQNVAALLESTNGRAVKCHYPEL